MWDVIAAIVSWFLQLIGVKQSAKQVQSQNVGQSDAEQGLEKAQNQAQQQEKQDDADTKKLDADASGGADDGLRREVDDVNASIDRKPGASR
jgi:hypothetical protein